MWNTTDFGAGQGGDGGEAGGFFNSANKFDSPGTGKKKDIPKRAQSLTPVVIKMLEDCQEEDFKMWGAPTHILKIVGIVRSLEITSTKVTYEIEDHTGKIPAVLWLEQDASSQPDIPVDTEGIYVKVFGTLRCKGGEKLLMILRIAPIISMNEPTTHLLEILFVRFKREKMSYGEEMMIPNNNPGAELSNSMSFSNTGIGMGGEDDGFGMTPVQQKVFRSIKGATSKVGIHRDKIMEQFPKQQHREAVDAIDFLVSEGHVFSTINHDHFKLTDS